MTHCWLVDLWTEVLLALGYAVVCWWLFALRQR